MNKTHRTSLALSRSLLLTALLGTAPAALAETSLSYTVGAATDYVFRGVSQTNGDPFVFASVNLSSGAFYAGAGAENVDFGNDIDLEYDIYGGWRPALGAWQLDIGVVRYGYRNQPDGVDIDTIEYKLAAGRSFNAVSLGAAVLYTTDYFGSDDSGTYAELNAKYAINPKWSLGGAYGQQSISAGTDFATWNFGISYAAVEHVMLDLRYYDTDAHEFGKNFEDRIVAALNVSL
ncbi:hypothetical protein E4T66_07345 [Sinimarinibacterium sp. CAU 1509]|uniref:TorF family putative porin n=1 Tax=Sinimarinibacterium sp. CAU 1509 TaxID=2562283 RepID=UPI0010AD928C|nr:TorF family putative porin [Sinimarinibacterium sp. CAU 1509]TJY62046.1 hypothetical protein E4T66_07345 [Sinimarinibacterium sp. CAU 1509]